MRKKEKRVNQERMKKLGEREREKSQRKDDITKRSLNASFNWPKSTYVIIEHEQIY